MRVAAVEAESIGLPFARSVISVTRTLVGSVPGQSDSTGTRLFVSSLDPRTPPKRLSAIAKSHWAVENKNHWKRDALWQEDSPRFRRHASAMALALLRGALLSLIKEPAPSLFARCRRRPASAFHLIRSPLLPLN